VDGVASLEESQEPMKPAPPVPARGGAAGGHTAFPPGRAASMRGGAAALVPQGGRAAFAGRELACGGLFGGSNRGGYRVRQ